MKRHNLSQKVSEAIGKVSQKISTAKATPKANNDKSEWNEDDQKDVGGNIVDRKR